jgi:hypothetical protein
VDIKREVDRWLSKLEVGQILTGFGTNAIKIKSKLQDITSNERGHKDVSLWDSGVEMGLCFNKSDGQEGKKFSGKEEINIGLNKG